MAEWVGDMENTAEQTATWVMNHVVKRPEKDGGSKKETVGAHIQNLLSIAGAKHESRDKDQ